MKKFNLSQIYLSFFIIFVLTCDERQPSEAGASAIDVTELLAWSTENVIDIIDETNPETVNFSVMPLDENSSFVADIDIALEVLEGPGLLESGLITADTTAAAGQFTIIPIAEIDPPFSFSDTSIVKAWVDGLESVSTTISFVYQDGGVSGDATNLEILSVTPDSISLGEESIVGVYLYGVTDGINTGIPNQWVRFESLVPSDDGGSDDGEGGTTQGEAFGEMNPEFSQTDSLGIAYSTFYPQNNTGFAHVQISQVTGGELTAETYIEVVSGESTGFSLELLIPSDNNLMVTGGGGHESVEIGANILDGFGNLVDEEYAVIFTVPCPYPIDGQCPVGDLDYSNDIMLNGQSTNGQMPRAISYSTNGNVNVNLNSGNRPGIVRINAELCAVEDIDDDNICDNILAEAESIAATISTGPANYGQVVAGWTEADSTGGGVYSLPITAQFWDQWTNPIADSTNVYWFLNPEYIASVDPVSQIGNCSDGEPGQACTNAYYTSGDIFNQGQICAEVYNQDNQSVLACSGGARCEDYNESNCLSEGFDGCEWNDDLGECYFRYSELYCNTFYDQESCESDDNMADAPFNCTWSPNALTTIPEWQIEINDGAGCHYQPILDGIDEQQFSFDSNGDGFDESFTGEWEATFQNEIVPDDPICNRSDMNYLDYQEFSDECESNPICSWEFVASDTNSEDGMIGTCVYNGGAGYFNPCVDCEIEVIPLSPTVTDFCQTDDAPLEIIVRAHLRDSYGDDVHLGNLLMAVFDATAFYFISSDDTNIDEDMGYEFDPAIPASSAQITDANGEAYWIVQLPPDNCHNTNPDDPDVFTCDNIYFRVYLLDPLYGESIDLSTTLYKNCQP